MQTSDFHYDLPDSLIAQFPTEQRSDSRLLRMEPDGQLIDAQFPNFAEYLNEGDLLVFNDTRVIPARMYGKKSTGGQVEILIERVTATDRMLCHVRASKSPKPDSLVYVGDIAIKVLGRDGELFDLEVQGSDVDALMQAHGHMPLPPYIERDDSAFDEERYQTVYSERPGAVAAPTAGLHFDDAMLEQLEAKGVEIARVTLHVGAGTFQPVRVENIAEHIMHKEWLQVSQEVCDAVAATKARGGKVVAVGTTSVRSLETAAKEGELKPFTGDTQLFITPGFKFNVVDMLLTNFHLPESTLLMLVSAFAGYDKVMAAYRHAVAQKYRFFSYGDAMLLSKEF